MAVHLTCNVYPCSQLNATTSLTIYLSPALMPLAGIIGSGHVVRPTAKKKKRFGFVFLRRHSIAKSPEASQSTEIFSLH